jgi:hypothetical protein
MSKLERHCERALVALKSIARTMGNVVFRVEDYRTPHTRSRIWKREEQRSKAESPSSTAKRAGRS